MILQYNRSRQPDTYPFAETVNRQRGEIRFLSRRVGMNGSITFRIVHRKIGKRQRSADFRFRNGTCQRHISFRINQFCPGVRHAVGPFSGVIDAEDVRKRKIFPAASFGVVKRSCSGGNQSAAVPDKFPQTSGLLRSEISCIAHDQRFQPAEILARTGNNLPRRMQTVQHFRHSKHFVEHRVFPDGHVVGASAVEILQFDSVNVTVHAARH